jgi:hypothetical protein
MRCEKSDFLFYCQLYIPTLKGIGFLFSADARKPPELARIPGEYGHHRVNYGV